MEKRGVSPKRTDRGDPFGGKKVKPVAWAGPVRQVLIMRVCLHMGYFGFPDQEGFKTGPTGSVLRVLATATDRQMVPSRGVDLPGAC